MIQDEPLQLLTALGLEADGLLRRYLPELYDNVPGEAEELAPSRSLLFQRSKETSPGIPLTEDFKREFRSLSKEYPQRAFSRGMGAAFKVQRDDFKKFLSPEVLSPDLLALGKSLSAKGSRSLFKPGCTTRRMAGGAMSRP